MHFCVIVLFGMPSPDSVQTVTQWLVVVMGVVLVVAGLLLVTTPLKESFATSPAPTPAPSPASPPPLTCNTAKAYSTAVDDFIAYYKERTDALKPHSVTQAKRIASNSKHQTQQHQHHAHILHRQADNVFSSRKTKQILNKIKPEGFANPFSRCQPMSIYNTASKKLVTYYNKTLLSNINRQFAMYNKKLEVTKKTNEKKAQLHKTKKEKMTGVVKIKDRLPNEFMRK